MWVNNYFYTFFKRCWWGSRYEPEMARIKSFIGYQHVSKTRLSAPLLMKARMFKFLKFETKILRKAIPYRVKERFLDRAESQRAREDKIRPVYNHMLLNRFSLPTRVLRPQVEHFDNIASREEKDLTLQGLFVEEPYVVEESVRANSSGVDKAVSSKIGVELQNSDSEFLCETSHGGVESDTLAGLGFETDTDTSTGRDGGFTNDTALSDNDSKTSDLESISKTSVPRFEEYRPQFQP